MSFSVLHSIKQLTLNPQYNISINRIGRTEILIDKPKLKTNSISYNQIKSLQKIKKEYSGSDINPKKHTNTQINKQLEQRLNVLVFRLGFTRTILEANHLITRRKILVNHNIIKNPYFIVEVGSSIICNTPNYTHPHFIHSLFPYFTIPSHLKLIGINKGILISTPLTVSSNW